MKRFTRNSDKICSYARENVASGGCVELQALSGARTQREAGHVVAINCDRVKAKRPRARRLEFSWKLVTRWVLRWPRKTVWLLSSPPSTSSSSRVRNPNPTPVVRCGSRHSMLWLREFALLLRSVPVSLNHGGIHP